MLRPRASWTRPGPWGFWVLTALAAVLPFELVEPLARVGVLSLSNVEALLYLVVVLAGLAVVAGTRPRLTWVHGAVLLWCTALLVSALLAPVHQASASKFALRGVGGGALFFAATVLVRTRAQLVTIMSALAGGTVLAAATAPPELLWADAREALNVFKTQPTVAGGFLRASGTFQYANTAAMYWEATLPLLLALSAWAAAAGRRTSSTLAIAGAMLVGSAVALTASRGGFVTAGVVLGLLALAGRNLPRLRSGALAALAALLVVGFGQSSRQGGVALRLRGADASMWHHAAFVALPERLSVPSGSSRTVSITVRNDGILWWPARGEDAVHVSYHWMGHGSDELVLFEGARTRLPHDVAPGETVTVPALVAAPLPPGRYSLQWDLVRETITWFSTQGAPVRSSTVVVTEPRGTRPLPRLPSPGLLPREHRPGRLALWSAGLRMFLEDPVTGKGPDNFRLIYGPYLALADFDDRITANSWYIETLATLGVFGLMALASVLATAGIRLRDALVRTRDRATRALLLGLAGGLTAYVVHGLIDYFLEFTPTYGLWWLLMGLADRLTIEERRT